MNPKIFVIVAIIALAAALGGILLSGSSFISSTQKNDNQITSHESQKILPISIELNDVSILDITKRSAIIETSFKISNPNPSSIIIQVMDYQLFETGFSNDSQISGGQIGSRPEGMVEFGSNYYTLLGDSTITLKDKKVLQNTGNTPELWAVLENNTAKWRVSGDIYFNLSSMTSGQENQIHFDLKK
ncbi:hypothetical protein [Candidatus Nitrosarchaeum limnium]|jgi:LEA14-like dessication related protein|uniref:Water stress and hypersensitive response domain-containing protein n=1 Tax=Candidatus Nitrosarchaeum limnium BG20 TaxID=859192 RepID=S2EX38_9ARCH|nr:hypothetical protein [Candidatus Nitrosarchaeum limnium]EPA06759.1 hypothetical protein BG20_I0043 [Candidatus Nitrosarchaeum limnium BG20]